MTNKISQLAEIPTRQLERVDQESQDTRVVLAQVIQRLREVSTVLIEHRDFLEKAGVLLMTLKDDVDRLDRNQKRISMRLTKIKGFGNVEIEERPDIAEGSVGPSSEGGGDSPGRGDGPAASESESVDRIEGEAELSVVEPAEVPDSETARHE